ncbi:MAG: hypothetical protein PHW52_00540 [Candidatus Pacebacteria bacterium]|nr:hypothetical protein [Candidatus Paceibacterota bacterium]
MMNYSKNILRFSFLGISASGMVFANDALQLSQTYPVIGVAPVFGVDFFVYLLNMSVVIGVVIAVVGLTYQGFQIMTAGANAAQVTDAKRSITGLFLGLSILAGSTVMLKAINPQLLEMNLNDLISEVEKMGGDVNKNVDRPLVKYTEIPIGANIESILNAVSTSPTQAYNYSSVKIGTAGPHTEEICYLYDKYGNAIDKNGDGYITEMDEYQGIDFRICINELLKATEHKMLYLNDGNYRCGKPGNNDEDSPLGNPDIVNWDADPSSSPNSNGYFNPDYAGSYDINKEGKTALSVNYHDWDEQNWYDLHNKNDSAKTDSRGDPVDDPGDNTVEKGYVSPELRCRYWGNCENDGLHGIVNNLKEYIRNGCICSETNERTTDLWAVYDPEYVGCEGTAGPIGVSFYCHHKFGCGVDWCYDNCDPFIGCCGGPRGRSTSCQYIPQNLFNNIYDSSNPYYQHDPCLKRKSMDCMREFMNIIVYGDVNTKLECSAQETKQGPANPIEMGWSCNDFVYNQQPEMVQARKTEFLLAYYQRLISFKKYYQNRMADLEKIEKYMMSDKRRELLSKGELQQMQTPAKERYSFDQSELGLTFPYETGAYRKRFNCAVYEDPNKLTDKAVYEDDEYRHNMFTCTWNEDQYDVTQRDNKLVRIKTGDLISNLHVDKSMERTGPNSEALADDEEDRRICSRGELETLQGKNALFNNVKSSCLGGYEKVPTLEGVPAAMFDISKRRFVQWKDDIYNEGGYSYLDKSEKYWTGEDMAVDGDPLTFYALSKPAEVVDPYYTGRDKMPYYFKPGFIDYSQYSENSAIDTEVGTERGFLLPSLIPVGQLSYHTKIYAKQMIRTIDRTLEQMEAAIIAFDNIANVYVEGGAAEGGGDYSGISSISKDTGIFSNGGATSTGCDCETCTNSSDCHCVAWTKECGCIHYACTDTCSACKPSSQKTCFACAKVTRYSKFLTPSYTDYYGKNNSEPVVEDVINDELPGKLKLIVHNMSCPDGRNKPYLGLKAFLRPINTQYEKVVSDIVVKFAWDGNEEVFVSSSASDMKDVVADDILIVENLANGKKKQYGPVSHDLWRGQVDIKDLLAVGNNEIRFTIQDYWASHISSSDIYIHVKRKLPPLPCSCMSNAIPEYSPPEGYTVAECNAWDRDLNEERSCQDYTKDIVVYLEAAREDEGCPCHEKPVMYFYPQQEQDIKVKLDYKGQIIADYPKYSDLLKGWSITAYPDGRIINHEDGQEYNYLFWEGIPDKKIDFDMTEGFVVRGEETKDFLQKKLAEIGLTPKEYNEFIVYWYPKMKDNKYNLIHFAGKEYTDVAPIDITPKPDSLLRVFMVYKALDSYMEVRPQDFKTFERKGFSVVEWGGTEEK